MSFARSVLVTGGNRGLGLGLVKQLVGKTQHLFAACRSPHEAEELQSLARDHNNITILQLDVTRNQSVADALAVIAGTVGQHGLNCLINNAGVLDEYTTIEGITPESLNFVIATNAVGPAVVSKSCIPLLRRASKQEPESNHMGVSRAGIINVSAILGSIGQNNAGRNYGYRMSKAALNMVTKNLSVELRKERILAASIHPGWVRTSIGGKFAPLSIDKAAKGLLYVASTLREEDSGGFFNHDGNHIPW